MPGRHSFFADSLQVLLTNPFIVFPCCLHSKALTVDIIFAMEYVSLNSLAFWYCMYCSLEWNRIPSNTNAAGWKVGEGVDDTKESY